MAARERAAAAVHPHACGEDEAGGYMKRGGTEGFTRACGEDVMPLSAPIIASVHPARVGKTVARWSRRWRGIGSFTRVGKTSSIASSQPDITVHPHACGEDDTAQRTARIRGGVHPTRVRKTYGGGSEDTKGRRFTPTRVGKTAVRFASSIPDLQFTPTRVGKTRSLCYVGRAIGSPPRVWGRRHWPALVEAGHWFTPTRVGGARGRHAA